MLRVRTLGMSFVFAAVAMMPTESILAKSTAKKPVGKVADKKRKPDSESCGDTISIAANLFAKEYGLDKAAAKAVQVKPIMSKSPKVVTATHSEFCGSRGCETVLFVVDESDCVKLALIYKGNVEPLGSMETPYQKVAITTRREGVDGGGDVRTVYVFDAKASEYREIKE